MSSPAGHRAAVSDRAEHDARVALDRCDELATISALPGRIDRFYLTPEHARANELAGAWMTAAGMTTWQDAAGNQVGRLEGSRPGLPTLILGSHLDSVPDAGRYDGPLGVVIAIAVVDRLRARAAELPFALEVMGFGDEEGARFGATLLGSHAVAGTWDPAWLALPDADGVSLAAAFEAFGLDPGAVGTAAHDPESVVGYLEAHIEQGTELEDADRPLGIVRAIAGARRFALAVLGEARHAGGTPFGRRRDALIGASHAVLEIARLAESGTCIATVGQMRAYPGAVNVIPGRAEFSLDLRAERDAARDDAWERMHDSIVARCTRLGLRFVDEQTHIAPAVRCSPRLSAALAEGIYETAGDTTRAGHLSKAGHDAMAMAALTDIGMLFIRCEDGISHHPAENVRPDDVAVAVDAFERAVLEVATTMPAAGTEDQETR